MRRILRKEKGAALSAPFLKKVDILDDHSLVERLTHIIIVRSAMLTPLSASISTPVFPSHLTVQSARMLQLSGFN